MVLLVNLNLYQLVVLLLLLQLLLKAVALMNVVDAVVDFVLKAYMLPLRRDSRRKKASYKLGPNEAE
jgi:hypothetical protein